MDVDALLTELTGRYDGCRDAARAAPMAAYLRHQFAFIGLGSQARRAVDRAVLAGTSGPTEEELRELAMRCWAEPEREYQYFAVDYLRRWVPKLPASVTFVDTAESLIRSKSWWDTVDELAAHIVGPLVLLHPPLVATMDEWIESTNLWIANGDPPPAELQERDRRRSPVPLLPAPVGRTRLLHSQGDRVGAAPVLAGGRERGPRLCGREPLVALIPVVPRGVDLAQPPRSATARSRSSYLSTLPLR